MHSYKPSTHSLHLLQEEMRALCDGCAGATGDDACAFYLFLIGDLAAIEPLYGEHSFSFMMLEAGYITELLMDTAAEQHISLQECSLPNEAVDSCVSPELQNSFRLSDTHRLLHCLVGCSA